jgi:hypothetical protein
MATDLSKEPHMIIICGHYEGIDHRVVEHLVDLEISIGDYVLTNGAIAAVVVIDAVVRLLPGVLGDEQSAADDSFSAGLLETPQYTRPAEFRGWKIPDVLLSGNHAEIAKWRKEQALKRTKQNRPDLIGRGGSPEPPAGDWGQSPLPDSRKAKRELQTLLHPEMLGRAFQVLALAKNVRSETDPLAGFKFVTESPLC